MKKTDLDLVEHIDHRTEVRLKAMRHITDMTMFNLEQHDAGIIHEMRRSLLAIMDAMQDEIDARQEQRFHENWLES